jgi:hypothetical protein
MKSMDIETLAMQYFRVNFSSWQASDMVFSSDIVS